MIENIGPRTTSTAGAPPADVGPSGRRAALLLALVSTVEWLLLRLGDSALGVPLTSTDGLRAWLDGTDPAVLAAAVLRLVAMVLGGYLAVTTATALLMSVVGWRPAARKACLLMPSLFRRIVVGGSGLGLTGAVLTPVLAAAATDADPDRTAIMIKLEAADPAPTTSTPATSSSTTSTTTPSTTTPSTSTSPSTTPSTTTSTTVASAPLVADGTAAGPDGEETWIVRPGDSFWSIAEEIVTDEQSDRTTPLRDADIVSYWHALIDANRERLPDRDNPDLLFPGQELHLP